MIKPSRRSLLKKLTSIGILGAVGSFKQLSRVANASSFKNWQERLRSISIGKGHKDYELVRKSLIPWNTNTPNRFPEMIVQAKSENDVISAIKYAREKQLKVGLRCSGHNTAGAALRDGGVIIDLANLRSLSIDAGKKTASIQPGVVSAQLLQQALQHGLAFPVANCPTVAMGGYLLGGGLGMNRAHYGDVACYSVMSADVVLADGSKVTVSKDAYPELFWAVRGAGPGFFGVVTHFKLQLYPQPKSIYRSTYILPIDEIELVTRTLAKIMEIRDHRVTNSVLLMKDPGTKGDTSVDPGKVCLVSVIAYADTDTEAMELLAPYSQSNLAAKSNFKSENKPSLFLGLYPNMTGPGRLLGDSIWAHNSDALLVLADHFRKVPSARSAVLCNYGVKPPPFRDDACFSMMENHYIANYMTWDEEKDDELNEQWLVDAIRILRPYTLGHYVNDADGGRYPDRIRNSFSQLNWERLIQLRQKYDPEGVFHTYLGQS